MNSSHICSVEADKKNKPHHSIWKGLLLSIIIASVAFTIHHLSGLHFLSPMILAVIIGIVYKSFITIPKEFDKGINFSLQRLLKIAIVFLGLQLSFSQVLNVGLNGLLAIFLTLSSTFLFCLWAGKLLGIDSRLTHLIAAGTSICGASAIVATNSVIRGKDEHVAYAISTVTLFGFLSMILYPVAGRLLHLDPHTFGFWSGASIHETAQVIGTAFQRGQESGEAGTVAKLSRIIFLVPVILTLAFSSTGNSSSKQFMTKKHLPIPWFIIGFMILVAVNSILTIDPSLKDQMKTANKFLLTISLSAMGLQMSFLKIRKTGLRPLCLGAMSWIFISTVSLILVKTFT